MPERRRDYAAEYRARIARGQARGLSRSQAAGHPRPDEPPVSVWRRAWRAIVGTPRQEPRRFIPPPPPVLRQVTDADYELVPPEESGIGAPEPVTFQTFYDDMLTAGEIEAGDMFAHDLLYTGWFDLDADSDSRMGARAMFYDYTGMTSGRFDWNQWKDWYTQTSG